MDGGHYVGEAGYKVVTVVARHWGNRRDAGNAHTEGMMAEVEQTACLVLVGVVAPPVVVAELLNVPFGAGPGADSGAAAAALAGVPDRISD